MKVGTRKSLLSMAARAKTIRANRETATDALKTGLGSLEISDARATVVERFSNFLEKSHHVKIWVRFNQSLPILALFVASGACYFAFNAFIKSKEDKLADAWRLLNTSSGKKFNQGQVTAMERLKHEANASFAYIDLHDSNLRNLRLSNCDLSHSNLAGADLEGADLKFCNLHGANLNGANLAKTHLEGVDFSDAKLRETNFSRAIVDIRFVYASDTLRANLTGAKFVYATEDEDEDGERWTSFLDTLGEDPDQDKWRRKFRLACASKIDPPNFGLLNGQMPLPNQSCNPIHLKTN
jgi:Pentapeptide repeats (8 copies)